MDLYSRKIVGFSTSITIDTKLIIRATEQAICNRMPEPGLIHHSDKGTQYTSNEFKTFAAKCGMILSMSGKGNCYDNAAMESFFHSFKTEHVFFCEYMTREEATLSIFEYIEIFYNRERTHSTLKYLSPVEFEDAFPPILSNEEEDLLPSPLQQSRVKLACAAMSASPAGNEAI
jgi:transposase InsO family protein